eukprot:429428_1
MSHKMLILITTIVAIIEMVYGDEAESCVCYDCTKGNPIDCGMKDMGCDAPPAFIAYAESLGFECLFRFPANAIQSCENHCVTPSPTTTTPAPTTTTTPAPTTTAPTTTTT